MDLFEYVYIRALHECKSIHDNLEKAGTLEFYNFCLGFHVISDDPTSKEILYMISDIEQDIGILVALYPVKNLRSQFCLDGCKSDAICVQ